MIEAAVIVCDGAEILPEHLPHRLRATHVAAVQRRRRRPIATLEAMERAHIELALRAMAGHRGQAARLLGISERNLYRKLREYRSRTLRSDRDPDPGCGIRIRIGPRALTKGQVWI